MRISSHRFCRIVLPLLLGVLLAVPLGGHAQDETASGDANEVAGRDARAITDSLLVHLSDAKLQRVADAYRAVEKVRTEYEEEWGSLASSDLPDEVEKEFLRSVMDVMESHDLAWEDYRNVVTAVKNSTRLQERFLPMIGQEVMVTASRIDDEESITNGRANGNFVQIEARQIEAMPLSSARDAIGLLPGIEPGMSIRGGAADEVSFNVDGMSMRMGRDGAPFTNISLTQIEEIHVQTGGFNAEYGNVRSGLVNVTTKGGIETPDLVNVSRGQLEAIARAYVRIQQIRRAHGLVNADLENLQLSPSETTEIESKMARAIAEAGVSAVKYRDVVEATQTNGTLRTRLAALIDRARRGEL